MFCNATIFLFRTLFQNSSVCSQMKRLAQHTWKGRDGVMAFSALTARRLGNPSDLKIALMFYAAESVGEMPD